MPRLRGRCSNGGNASQGARQARPRQTADLVSKFGHAVCGRAFGLVRQRPDRSPHRRHEALARKLPNGWHAWHSLRIRIPGGPDAEADFIILDPRQGIPIVEAGSRSETATGFQTACSSSSHSMLRSNLRDGRGRRSAHGLELSFSRGFATLSAGRPCGPRFPSELR